MSEHPAGPIFECFQCLEDPRDENLIDHKLLDIVVLTVCAVVSGANHWTEVESFGHAKEKWLRSFLELPHGIPSHDTIGDLFSRLDPEQFRACFLDWVKVTFDLITEIGDIVALDGKAVRRSHDSRLGKKAIHMVNAWASKASLVLAQVKVDDKSNEITALPTLLDMLELSGCIVTIDAMGCQKEIAQKVVDKGAHYVLAVKDNQPNLHRKIREMFTYAENVDFAHIESDKDSKTGKGHGRIETRTCWVIEEASHIFYIQGPRETPLWPGLKSIIKIQATRRIGDETSTETRYYISSLSEPASVMNTIVRSHWGVENSLHWVLDIAFREDESRVRKGNAPEILAILRQMALNLLRQEKTTKSGLQSKRLKAAWDTTYLMRVLSA
jgi:predicted transposase YbfD/YdcC